MKLAQRYNNYPSPSVTYLFFVFCFFAGGERITWILIEILFYLSLELLMDSLAAFRTSEVEGRREKKREHTNTLYAERRTCLFVSFAHILFKERRRKRLLRCRASGVKRLVFDTICRRSDWPELELLSVGPPSLMRSVWGVGRAGGGGGDKIESGGLAVIG